MVCRLKVVIGQLELRHGEVGELSVCHEMSRHATCRLDFVRDSSSQVRLEDLIGAAVEVLVTADDEAGLDGDPEGPVFAGEVTSASQVFEVGVGGRFVIEAASASHRLEAANLQFFKEQKFGDVARSIAGRHGLSIETIAGEDKREWVQPGTSDFDFIVRGADELGAFVETNLKNGIAIRDAARGPATRVVWGRDLLRLTAKSRPANYGFQGGGYDYLKREALAIRGVAKEPALLGGAAAIVNATKHARPGPGEDFGAEIDRARVSGPRGARDMLRLQSRRATAGSVLVEGESENPYLRAGTPLTIEHGQNLSVPIRGDFTIVSVRHQVVDGDYSNVFLASPYDVTLPLGDRPPRSHLGATTAIVVDNLDPERLGRIQVRYWWHDERTAWARLVRPHAGVNRGMYFVPEVDEEVFVVFEQGDPERPLIVGSLWNGVDTPPEPTREDLDDNNLKLIQTRSGNTILFDDADSREVIEVYSAEGKCLIQLHNDFGGSPTINVFSSGDISLNSKRDISLEAKNNILLKSDAIIVETQNIHQDVGADLRTKTGGSVSVDAGMDYLVKAGMSVGHEGGESVTSKAGLSLNLVGGVTTNIKGSLVQIQPPGFVVPEVSPKAPKALEPKAPADKDFTPGKGSG